MASVTVPAESTRLFPRIAFAVLCGIIAGTWIPSSLQTGLLLHFPAEQAYGWGPTLWGEHWALRSVASLVSAGAAGFIAGLVARRQGRWVGLAVALPATVLWLWVAVTGWTGTIPYVGTELHISLGNRLAATLITVALLPTAGVAAVAGAEIGSELGSHFDARPRTLLGIRWYHYLWIPFLVHLYLVQVAWAGYYGLGWATATWKAGADHSSFVPYLFTLALWGTFVLLGVGVRRAYGVLAGLDEENPRGSARAVFKFAVGYPLAAAALQLGVMLLHYGITRVLQ